MVISVIPRIWIFKEFLLECRSKKIFATEFLFGNYSLSVQEHFKYFTQIKISMQYT